MGLFTKRYLKFDSSKPTLIIIGGLPGVGKSYTCRILKKKLKNCIYFDSDLFAKKYIEKYHSDFIHLSPRKQAKKKIRTP